MFDAIRKVIELTGRLCEKLEVPGWRTYEANIKAIKKRYRKAQKLKHSTSKNEEVRQKRTDIINSSGDTRPNYVVPGTRDLTMWNYLAG